jgi:hypothetical protein
MLEIAINSKFHDALYFLFGPIDQARLLCIAGFEW